MSSVTELRRQLAWQDVVNVVVGIVIGAGIFVTPQELSRLLPSAEAMMMAWVVSGLLVFGGALAFAELSAMLPATGGLYIYLREAFGPAVAFSSGWVHLFALFSGATAFVAAGFARYLGGLLPLPEVAQNPITIALILGIGWLNARSVVWSVRVQNVANYAKLLALAGLIGLALFAPAQTAPAAASSIGLGTFGVALASCFFCYEGWSYAGFVAGEMKNPARDLPRAFTVSFLIVVGLYLMVNLSYVRVLSIAELQSSSKVGADVATRILGPAGGTLLTVVILLAIVGTVNGLTLAASRMYLAQSRDGLFLPGLEQIHPRWNTPARAVAAHAVASCVLLFSGSLGFILTLAIFAAWLYYAIAVLGLMRLRQTQPNLARPYRTWGYPVTPVLFLLGTLGFLGSLAMQSPKPALAVLAIVAVSFPIHALVGKSNKHATAVPGSAPPLAE